MLEFFPDVKLSFAAYLFTKLLTRCYALLKVGCYSNTTMCQYWDNGLIY